MARKTRHYNISLIKVSLSYTVQDITELYDGLHKNTVRQWFKKGLKRIDDKQPALAHGSDLKAFLKARQQSKKAHCAPNEFYCFKCRAPRQSLGNMVDVSKRTDQLINLSGLCVVCHTPMNKASTLKKLPEYQKIFDIATLAIKHINDTTAPTLNSDSLKGDYHDPK